METDILDTASPSERELWQRLMDYEFGDDEAARSEFRLRVAKEIGGDLIDAEQALMEYRKFCFLACTAGAEMTPSPRVDKVWHLHLTHTRDYWQRFCPRVLKTDLHHQPGTGEPDEKARFRGQYALTLERYRRNFGTPPAAFWATPSLTMPAMAEPKSTPRQQFATAGGDGTASSGAAPAWWARYWLPVVATGIYLLLAAFCGNVDQKKIKK